MTTRNFSPVGIGYHPDYIGAPVMNRTGATLQVGELVMLDMLAADAGFGGNTSAAVYVAQTPGKEGYPLANILTPTTVGIGALNGGTPGAYFGVVDDIMDGAGLDNTAVHVCWKGVVKVKMAANAGTAGTAPGEYGKVVYAADAVTTGTQTYTAGKKGLGRLLTEFTVANALSSVLFNGIEGMGIQSP